MSFLFTGTVEQSYVAHAMAYSACIGPYDNDDCRHNRGPYEIQNNDVQTPTTTNNERQTTTTTKLNNNNGNGIGSIRSSFFICLFALFISIIF